jgi:hypothetical protein
MPREKQTLGKLKPIQSGGHNSDKIVRLKKQDFKFNQKYWDSINPHKAEAIKKKYGLKADVVDPNKVHRPVRSKKINPTQKGDKK